MTRAGTRGADLEERAPAKINLALHVTGRRGDGYHLLDTLVVHGGPADVLTARLLGPATSRSETRIDLEIVGPFAAGLDAGPDNLVMRAARLLESEAARLGRPISDVALRLDKRLPIASGIGGGSSDAAATLRLLDRLWRLDLPRERLAEISLPLGADVPMCVIGTALRARGIGEAMVPIRDLPPLSLVLVNPGVAVSTPMVFRTLSRRDNPPLPEMPTRRHDLDHFVDWLATTRNDLQAAAVAVAPEIADALAWLERLPGCRFARMSGSGATCFALFAGEAPALPSLPSGWWAAAGRTDD